MEKKIKIDVLLKVVKDLEDLFGSVIRIYQILETENQKKKEFRLTPIDYLSPRKLTRQWSEYEDNRLLMRIYMYGLEKLKSIPEYVSNGRIHSQCLQRWSR